VAASVARKRPEEPVTGPRTRSSTGRPAHELQASGPCSFALGRLKGFPASLSEWCAVRIYRVLEVSTGAAGISIGGPE
jgi:hypothetical protein